MTKPIARELGRWLVLFLIAQGLLRFWMYNTVAAGELALSASALTKVFAIGVANDVMLFAGLASLTVLVAVLHRRIARVVLLLILLVIAVIVIVDIFFWFDFDGRANRLVFHYLAFPVEVLVFLEDQFALSFLILPLLGLVYWCYRLMGPSLARLQSAIDRARIPSATISIVILLGLFSWQLTPFAPWSSRHTNELGANGLQKVLHASLVDVAAWEGVFPEAAQFDKASRASVHYDAPLKAAGPVPKHVLLIIEESLAGPNWWDEERRARYMPNFDKWRKRGIYLDHLMATGTRTTRGVEAVLHGVPPLPGIALNQRDGFASLPSLPATLQAAGFETLFVYGGWPGFSNFKNYWSQIGFQTVLTRDDFESPDFETSWGVADEILFDRILQEMDTRTAASDHVFLSTLTVSNHRPFDFPDGRISFPANERKQEYAVAYADWALGNFLETAQHKAWFKDTMIVIVPDHGPNPAGDTLIPIESYRLPGIVLVPGVEPATLSGVGSLMDIPATILNQLCLTPIDGMMGRNLLAKKTSGVAPVEHDYMLGMYDGDYLTVLRRDQQVVAWQRNPEGEFRETSPSIEQAGLAASLFKSAYDQYLIGITDAVKDDG